MRFDNRPAIRAQAYDRNSPRGQILFVVKHFVAGYKDVKAGSFSGIEEFAILEAGKARVRSRKSAEFPEMMPQRMR